MLDTGQNPVYSSVPPASTSPARHQELQRCLVLRHSQTFNDLANILQTQTAQKVNFINTFSSQTESRLHPHHISMSERFQDV